MSEQLPLWEDEDDRLSRQARTWNRMYREFQEQHRIPDKPSDYDFTLRQEVCLRCGTYEYYGTLDINHDLGYIGCPTEHDPTWSRYEKAPGFQSVWDNGEIRSMLTAEEMCDRWDADKLPHCECGHPFGLHQYGRSCQLYCGCDGYEAKAPTTTH